MSTPSGKVPHILLWWKKSISNFTKFQDTAKNMVALCALLRAPYNGRSSILLVALSTKFVYWSISFIHKLASTGLCAGQHQKQACSVHHLLTGDDVNHCILQVKTVCNLGGPWNKTPIKLSTIMQTVDWLIHTTSFAFQCWSILYWKGDITWIMLR